MKTFLKSTPHEDEDLEELDEGAPEEHTPPSGKKDATMPKEAVATGGGTTQLATRVPATLYKRVKVFVVESDTSIMEFVGAALTAELQKRTGIKRGNTKH